MDYYSLGCACVLDTVPNGSNDAELKELWDLGMQWNCKKMPDWERNRITLVLRVSATSILDDSAAPAFSASAARSVFLM